jgi:hypothetical protein
MASRTSPRGFTKSTIHPLEDTHPPPEERGTFGHRPKHSPNLEWQHTWTKDTWSQGRVLLIDYISSDAHRLKIFAQEFQDLDNLRNFYLQQPPSTPPALRVIHVQNASWATSFLLRKYNIDATSDVLSSSFSRWVRFSHPQERGGKPVLNGRSFRSQRDPWRGISRTAFCADYLRYYDRNIITQPRDAKAIMELNQYDEGDQPQYGKDVYVQRLSVYVQYSEDGGVSDGNAEGDVPNPYDEEAWEEYVRLKKSYGDMGPDEHPERNLPKLRSLENGNTVICMRFFSSPPLFS